MFSIPLRLDRRTFLLSLAAAADPPLQWSEGKNVAWSTELAAKGSSSPAVYGEQAFVSSASGSNLYLECIDTRTGAQVWVRRLPASAPVSPGATPSPVVEAPRVFALYDSGDLAVFDLSGNLLWQRRLSEEFGLIDSAASLALTGDEVIAYFSTRGRNIMIAVDPQSSKVEWRSERPIPGASGTPLVTTAWNSGVIVVANRGSIEGFSPVNGQLIWQRDDMPRDSKLAAAGDRLLLGSAKPGGCVMLRIMPPGREPELVWKAEKATSGGATPLLHEEYAYFASAEGVLYCLNAETGRPAWTGVIKAGAGAALIGDRSRVYCFLRDGAAFVFETGRSPRKLAENDLASAAPVEAVVAIDGAFLLRSPNRLSRVGVPVVKPKPLWEPRKS